MCPYSQFEKGTVQFCEADLCSWIVHPADTVSNVGYLLVGLYLLKRDKRLAIAALAVALGSTAFHATNTFIGEFLDVSAMFMFSGFLIAKNLGRLGVKHEGPIHALIVLGSSLTLFLNHPIGIKLFTYHVIAAALLEGIIWIKERRARTFYEFDRKIIFSTAINYKPLLALVMVFAASYILWWVDQLGLVCNPNNHYFTWHSVWHLLNASAFYYAYLFYKGLPR